MPTYEIRVDGQRRSFLLQMPPDWAAYPWGSLPLLLGLHGGGQTADEFYAGAEIDALMDGKLTPDASGVPVPQKFIAIFPQGLSLDDDVKGDWNYGWGAASGLTAQDDVKAIVACVERADRLLGQEWARLNGIAAPATPFFADAGILIIGFSQGAGMAYRCGAELASTDTKWGMGALHPSCIAVAEHSAGGYQFANSAPWPGTLIAFPPLTVSLERQSPGASCSLLHMHSDNDDSSNYLGGVAATNMANVDRILGTPAGTALYYRWDIRPGPVAANPAPAAPFDPTAAPLVADQEAIGPWVGALPGGPMLSAVNSVTLDAGLPSERDEWTWHSAIAVFGAANWAVRFVLWHSAPGFNGGHYWPTMDMDGWSGTGAAWLFYQEHAK